ncbi:MAG: hypothetical protein WBX03_13965 [Terriglobales bacterium]
MNSRLLNEAHLRVNWMILAVIAWLLLSTGSQAAQSTLSAGPLLLHQVTTIYVAPSSDDFALLVKARLENWMTVGIASKPEEADAILTCQTQSTVVLARMVVRRTLVEVTLVDRRSQKLIWRTTKSGFDKTVLADDIMEQLKQDWRKSASVY